MWFKKNKNKMEKRKKYLGQGLNTDHLNVKSSARLLLQVTKLILITQGKLLYLEHLTIKFRKYMLSKVGGAVLFYQGFKDIFKETKQGFGGKSPTLTH